jgi:putative transposase
MPRPLRLIEPNGIYHVASRGNRRQEIQLDDRDYRRLAGLFAEALERFELTCHAWCFLGNHFHLVLQTPLANLSSAMQWAKSQHAARFNVRHGVTGHLFQGRFWSKQIANDAQLVSTVAYVLRNPMEAGLCEIAEDWPWTSARASLGLSSPGPIPVGDLVLAVLDGDVDRAREKLRRHVYAREPAPPFRLAA